MARHWIVWHPEEENAFCGSSAAAVKELGRRDARFGKPARWHQLQVEGWLLSAVEGP